MQSSKLEYIEGTVTVSGNTNSWTSESMEERINVTKVIVKPGQGLMLYFNGVNDGTLIDVVVTSRRRPHYEDFANAKMISKDSKFHYVPSDDYPERSFYYVGVLPTKKMVESNVTHYRKMLGYSEKDVTIKYEVAFESAQCVSWISAGRTWDDGSHCKVAQSTGGTSVLYRFDFRQEQLEILTICNVIVTRARRLVQHLCGAKAVCKTFET